MALDDSRAATLDTGALIALVEIAAGRSSNVVAKTLLARMRDRNNPLPVSAPTPVLAEWWRGEAGPAAAVRDAVTAVPTSRDVAIDAGLLLAALGKSYGEGDLLVMDAIVVVSAARRHDDIYTSDTEDIVALRDKLVEMGKLPNREAVRIRRV